MSEHKSLDQMTCEWAAKELDAKDQRIAELEAAFEDVGELKAAAESEVASQRDALAAAEQNQRTARNAWNQQRVRAEAAEAEVTRLTEALAAAKADDTLSRTQRDVLQVEFGRLKEALAAAERKLNHESYVSDKRAQERDAAEARVRELEAELARVNQ